MRAVIQRVQKCSVTIEGTVFSSIGKGILILLGVKSGDTNHDAEYLAARCAALRLFDDATGRMNLSVVDVSGEVMVVSQFTLYGDTRIGNRPSYSEAAAPEIAEALYNHFVSTLRRLINGARVSTGVFRAMMEVHLVNDGPVTLMVESKIPPVEE